VLGVTWKVSDVFPDGIVNDEGKIVSPPTVEAGVTTTPPTPAGTSNVTVKLDEAKPPFPDVGPESVAVVAGI
jgi:hypothetical protein